jgi:hypothetical protein
MSAPAPATTLDQEETTAEHAAAEGAEPTGDVGSPSTLREMLLATDPQEDLERVESPWDPERGGRNRIYRGLQKMIDVSGMPAIVDIVVGLLEEVHALNLEGSDGNDSEDGGSVDAQEIEDPAAKIDGGG